MKLRYRTPAALPPLDSRHHRKLASGGYGVVAGVLLVLLGWVGLLGSGAHLFIAPPLIRWLAYASMLSVSYGLLPYRVEARLRIGQVIPVLASSAAGFWLGLQSQPTAGVPLLIAQIVLEAGYIAWTGPYPTEIRATGSPTPSELLWGSLLRATVLEALPSLLGMLLGILIARYVGRV